MPIVNRTFAVFFDRDFVMDNKIKLNTLMFATVLIILFTVTKANASIASVYSVNSGRPLVTSESIKVSTITKGFKAANDPVYKVVTQTVPKALFVSTLRSGFKFLPYVGIAYAAYDYYYNDELEEYTKTESIQTGECKVLNSYYGILALSTCLEIAKSNAADHYTFDRVGFPQYGPTDGTALSFIFKSSVFGGDHHLGSLTGIETDSVDVVITDAQVWDYTTEFLSDPSSADLNMNELFLNADGTVNQDAFPDPDFEYITPEDSELIDLYGSGLLQDTDPNGANYVTPEELARIKALYDEANRTDEEKAEDLTADVDKPLTREQYAEEQLLKEARQESFLIESATGIKSLTETTNASDEYTVLADQGWADMTQLLNTTNDLPDTGGFISYFEFNSTTGCETISLPFGVIFPTTSQCEKLGSLKELFGYFLFVLVGWNIITTVLKEAN